MVVVPESTVQMPLPPLATMVRFYGGAGGSTIVAPEYVLLRWCRRQLRLATIRCTIDTSLFTDCLSIQNLMQAIDCFLYSLEPSFPRVARGDGSRWHPYYFSLYASPLVCFTVVWRPRLVNCGPAALDHGLDCRT